MHPLLALSAAAPVPVDGHTAAAIAHEHFGVDVRDVARLDAERDEGFRIDARDGSTWALKLAHTLDGVAVVELETAALAHVAQAEPALPVPRVRPTVDGALVARVETDAGLRGARLVSWQTGTMLADAGVSVPRLAAVGTVHGRLLRAFEGFAHPAAVARPLAWDLARLPEFGELLALAPDLTEAFERFAAVDASALPRQVIHGDLHRFNVLVDDAHGRVTGVIDFGDVVESTRAADLGIALSYVVDPDAGPVGVREYLAAVRSHLELTAAELALLPEFVRGRIVQRILLGEHALHAFGSLAAAAGLERSRAQLAALDREPWPTD